jgi:hypothetical protein
MPTLSDYENLSWAATNFRGKVSQARQEVRSLRFFFPRYLQPNNYTDDVYAARVSELDFPTACRGSVHKILASKAVISLSPQEWEAVKHLLSAGDKTPPRDFGSNALDALPIDLQPLFKAQYVKEIGPIKQDGEEEVSGADAKNGEELREAETELGKLDAALEEAAIETTPADVQLKKSAEPVAGRLNKHRKIITVSEATCEGKLGLAAGKEELLRPLEILSSKFYELVEHYTQNTEQLKAYFEGFDKELQSCRESLIPALASAPKSAGS